MYGSVKAAQLVALWGHQMQGRGFEPATSHLFIFKKGELQPLAYLTKKIKIKEYMYRSRQKGTAISHQVPQPFCITDPDFL